MAQLVQEVYTVEVYPELSRQAQQVLEKLGYQNIKYQVGNGKLGWKELPPFDKTIITAVANEIPPLLLGQLKNDGKIIKRQLIPVRFVPLL